MDFIGSASLGLIVDAQQLFLVEDHLVAAAAGQVFKTARQLDRVEGQASSHMQQKMQRSSSMREALGYFSRSGPGTSTPTMSMTWDGKSGGAQKEKQATPLHAPRSSLFKTVDTAS